MNQKKLTSFTAWPQISSPQNCERKQFCCQFPSLWYFVMLALRSVQLLSCVRLFVTTWTAAHQASLSITNSKLIYHESKEGRRKDWKWGMIGPVECFRCPEEKTIISIGDWLYTGGSFMDGYWVLRFTRVWTSKMGWKKKLHYTFRN